MRELGILQLIRQPCVQAPDMYRAAAVRNPVTNIATMLGSTDIPDWFTRPFFSFFFLFFITLEPRDE